MGEGAKGDTETPTVPDERVHTNWAGAVLNAQLVVEGLKSLGDPRVTAFLKPVEDVRQLLDVGVGQIGGELRVFVIDFQVDDAALLLGRDAHVVRQRPAQRLEGLHLVAGLQIETFIQRTPDAVGLQQRDVELVGRLGGQAAETRQATQ